MTIAICLVYMAVTAGELNRKCLMDRDLRASSFYCLNEFDLEGENLSVSDHRGSLFLLGFLCATFVSVAMFFVSRNLFQNMKRFLGLFPSTAAVEKQHNGFVSNHMISAADQIESQHQKSPKKRNRSPRKTKKRDSLSSFRNLLERDSDSSMLPFPTDQGGYDSSAQISMSTQANALNLSERGTMLNQSLGSVRDVSGNVGGGKKHQQNNGNALDLLPIDEDIDEQQCSPIKPKKRTKEDSPFKRN